MYIKKYKEIIWLKQGGSGLFKISERLLVKLLNGQFKNVGISDLPNVGSQEEEKEGISDISAH